MRNLINIIETPIPNTAWSELMEKIIDDYTNPYLGGSFPIHRNGSAGDLAKLRNNLHPDNGAEEEQIRGLLSPSGDLYFWDAYAAVHSQIKNRYDGMMGSIHLYLGRDTIMISAGRSSLSSKVFDEFAEIVRNNRNIRRIYGRNPVVGMHKGSVPTIS